MKKQLNLQIHRLFSLPFSCVNRGENNEIKTTMFGGQLRGRISGQALKRAVREMLHENLRSEEKAIRTTNLIPAISKIWEEDGSSFTPSEAEADALKSNLTAIGTAGEAKGKAEKSAPLFIGFGELRKITEHLKANPEELKALCVAQSFKLSDAIKNLAAEKGENAPKSIKILTQEGKPHRGGNIPSSYDTPEKLEEIYEMLKSGPFTLDETEAQLKALGKSEASKFLKEASNNILQILASNAHGPDVAINGRMNAGNQSASVDSTCMFAHAISIGVHDIEEDFFSVMDECEVKEHNGAGLIGRNEGASLTYYGFANLDIRSLYENLNGNQKYKKDEVINLILSFVEASILSLPKARQSTMFGRTLPHYVRVTVKPDAQVFSNAEAFVKPVFGSEETGAEEEAIKRLEKHKETEKAFGTNNYILDETIQKEHGSLVELKSKLKALLESELD
jgi:CRISPR system Cascade subunit CasC